MGGKVAILTYGNVTSDYFVSESRKWSVPEDWTQDQVDEFVEARREEIRMRIDALATSEFEERFDQSYLSGDK